ncbi:MAG: AAA family ATPase, partial [Acidimicrobiales bacterium]
MTEAALSARFQLGRVLKQGNGVTTYLGEDRRRGQPVVVKTVAAGTVPTPARLRLEHEAAVLERLGSSPGFRPLLASGHEGGLFYLVQPLMAGVTLAARLADGPLSVAATLRVAADILAALQVAHDHEVLHRDVKPANVIVEPGEMAGSTVLIDFGLARSAGLDPSLQGEPVGTARYLAPEAAGLLDLAVDERSDLYAAGIVLFECLAGEPPFMGTSVGEVLRQHLSLRPPRLRSLGLPVPRALDGVIQRLLAKEPDERYQTAAAALADIEAIADAMDAGSSDPPVTPGRHEARHVLTEPAFVGRADELATLMAALAGVDAGQRALVVIEAESGGGKTRLLDELAIEATQLGAWVLRGHGADQAAQRPFQLLDGVVDEVVHQVGADPALGARLRRELGDRAEAVGAAVPPLATILASGDASGLGPEAYGEARSVDALAGLLDALGTAERPALLLLDDCQWADGLASRLLARWHQGPAIPPRHVLVVVAFRSEEVGPGHPLRGLEPTATLRLDSFGPADVARLCESMAGPLPAEALAVVVRLADGSPFMASAVLRGLVESGALEPTGAGWAVDPEAMGEVRTSRRAALFLLRRFELLSPEALRLLEVGAVLGKTFGLDLAVELAGQDPSQVTVGLDEARGRRILWLEEDHRTCSFAHDKLREALLGRLSPTERMVLHRRAAERIEAIGPDRVFELAYHFDAADEPARALPYALRAAEVARGRHALDVAALHFRMAQKAAVHARDGERLLAAGIDEGLADVLTLQGSYAEAKELLERALDQAAEPVRRAVLDGKLGDLAFKRGDQASASRHLEGALRDLGRWVPRHGLTFTLAAVWEVVVQAMHTLLPRRLLGRRTVAGQEREFLAMRMYSRLAYVYWFHAGKVPCAWTHLRGLNLAERYPPTPELAQACSEHAPVMTMAPWTTRGIAYARRSHEIRRSLGDVWGQGQSLGFYGVVLYAASRYAETIEQCQEAVRLLERTGDRWEQHTASWHIAYAHYRLGELGPAVEVARHLYEDASAIGDQAAAGISLSVWAKASSGRVPAALVAAELARDNEDAHTATEVRVADGIRLLFAGDTDGAVARLTEAARVSQDAGLRQEYVAPVLPWLATAQRTALEQAAGHAPRRRLRAAARTARRADRLSRSYRNNRPHALRERGLIADLSSRPARARRLLAASLAVAEAQGARYEAALSRLAAAQVAQAQGRPDAGPRLEGLLAAVAGFEAAVAPPPGERPVGAATGTSLSLADRFEGLLAAGRQIASAPSPSAVYRAVRDASLNLLRGDTCHVVLVGDDGVDLLSESGQIVDATSRSLLERAISTRAPVTSGGDNAADPSESLVLSDVRSVLCAPILCEDRVVACLTTTHRQIGGLFGDAEVKLASFVATLAGAALDHVAGSEARFRSLAQNASDVITIVDPEGAVMYQSSSVSRVFGYEGEGLVGRDVRDWVHPEDLHLLLRFFSSGPEDAL